MHYTPHALLNCVAWFSLLAYGNTDRLVPTEGLSYFARTVSSVLEPTLANEVQSSRLNDSATRGEGLTISRRQVDSALVPRQEPNNAGPAAVPRSQLFPNQGYPFQYERTYQYRYPSYGQQISKSFFPGGPALNNQQLSNGLPIDPRFFQPQIGSRLIESEQLDISRPLNTNIKANNNDNSKDIKKSNGNSIQNLDPNIDSKSSAQSRPFDGPEFSNSPGINNQDPGLGNLRVDNRFSAIDYERVRQNYYSDPPINQQRNYYSSFNDIPLNGGPPYRSPINGRYSSGLDYSGGGLDRSGITSSDPRSTAGIDGVGDPYFNGFLQGPYRSFGYNALASNVGGVGGSSSEGNLPYSENFRLPFNGPQYSGGFGGPFYSRGLGRPENSVNLGFDNGDSSLRASVPKEILAEAITPRGLSQKIKEQNVQNGGTKGTTPITQIVEKDRANQA